MRLKSVAFAAIGSFVPFTLRIKSKGLVSLSYIFIGLLAVHTPLALACIRCTFGMSCLDFFRSLRLVSSHSLAFIRSTLPRLRHPHFSFFTPWLQSIIKNYGDCVPDGLQCTRGHLPLCVEFGWAYTLHHLLGFDHSCLHSIYQSSEPHGYSICWVQKTSVLFSPSLWYLWRHYDFISISSHPQIFCSVVDGQSVHPLVPMTLHSRSLLLTCTVSFSFSFDCCCFVSLVSS